MVDAAHGVGAAILGRNTARGPGGGLGGHGRWEATKWFLDDGETEIFFNFSLAERRAELSQKDGEYDAAVAAAFARALRDGKHPPPRC